MFSKNASLCFFVFSVSQKVHIFNECNSVILSKEFNKFWIFLVKRNLFTIIESFSASFLISFNFIFEHVNQIDSMLCDMVFFNFLFKMLSDSCGVVAPFCDVVEETIFTIQCLKNIPHVVGLHLVEICINQVFWWLIEWIFQRDVFLTVMDEIKISIDLKTGGNYFHLCNHYTLLEDMICCLFVFSLIHWSCRQHTPIILIILSTFLLFVVLEIWVSRQSDG